jgi:hypothetical protein
MGMLRRLWLRLLVAVTLWIIFVCIMAATGMLS